MKLTTVISSKLFYYFKNTQYINNLSTYMGTFKGPNMSSSPSYRSSVVMSIDLNVYKTYYYNIALLPNGEALVSKILMLYNRELKCVNTSPLLSLKCFKGRTSVLKYLYKGYIHEYYVFVLFKMLMKCYHKCMHVKMFQ